MVRWSGIALAAVVGILTWNNIAVVAAEEATRFTGATSSQPLALSADGSLLAVVNPDNDSVTFFRTEPVDGDPSENEFIGRFTVGDEPWGVALSPDGKKAFVAGNGNGTVTILRLDRKNPAFVLSRATIHVGTEPYSLVLTPNGRKLYVANARSNSISVIDTYTEQVVKTITNVGFEPRGLAVTNDGDDDDNDETLYVSQFLSLPVAGKLDGADDAKVGHVTVISTGTDTVIKDVVIQSIDDTGFKAAGDALARIPPGAQFTFQTGAYPNQLNNIAIRGHFAFLPNTGASPNGPVRFNVNTQSLLSVIDTTTNTDAGKTINMHRAVGEQTNPARRFITVPWAMAFEHDGDEGFVVSAASNIVVKVKVDLNTGLATVQRDPIEEGKVLQIPTGKNPRGIVIDDTDSYAYVMNYISRDVSIIDLTGAREQVVATLKSADQPPAGSKEEMIHIGKELYNTSIGEFDPPTAGAPPIVGRMSAAGWGSCSSCHPFGLTDNVVWIFPAGPRKTIAQHADFDPSDPDRKAMRVLNWSANRDEQPDFSLNIRAVSGGLGLIVLDDGITPDPNVQDFLPLANTGRKQLKVRGVNSWDAITAFVQFGIRPPISPVSKTDPQVISGEALFRAANCQSCHGTASWTTSRVRYTPPPNPAQIVNGQLVEELRKVGTFDPTVGNEIRQNAAPPLGADGFVPNTLLSISAFPQTFLHNGIATSLDEVLANVTHRSAGTAGVDTLSNPADRAAVVQFLLSIDGSTPPINP